MNALFATSFTCLLSMAPTFFEIRLTATESKEGILVREGDVPVLFYQRKTKSLEGKYARAHYIHPLYDLNGNVLTEDFPPDHLHHRGIFWAWHQVWIGNQKIGDPWSIENFHWNVREAKIEQGNSGSIVLKTQIFWESPLWVDRDSQLKPLVKEDTAIEIYPTTENRRAIDFTIRLQALESAMRSGGSEDIKGYGGFSTRIRLPKDITFLGKGGMVTPQNTPVIAGSWLDMLASFGSRPHIDGLSLHCHPTTPGYPQPWILRSSGSMQNAVFPGNIAVPLKQDQPLIFRYRLVIHRGRRSIQQLESWQQDYETIE